MILSLKNLRLAAALALGSASATNAVAVPQAQAEHEVQADPGNIKSLRAAALQDPEVQRDAIPFLDDAKPRDRNSAVEPFVGRQLDDIGCTAKEGEQCFRIEKYGCCTSSECHFLDNASTEGFCGYAPAWTKCNESLPCHPSDGCLLPNNGAAKVCIEGAGLAARLARDQDARIEALEMAVGVIDDPEERIGTLETHIAALQEALVSEERIGTLEARIAALEGVDAANLIQAEALDADIRTIEASIAALEGVDAANLIEALETRIGVLEEAPVSQDDIRTIETMTFAEARDRARAREEINKLSRYEFLSLISLSDGPGRAALTRTRTYYKFMFAGFNFASHDIMGMFYPHEWRDICEKFGITNGRLLPAWASIKTNDLHLSEWQIPENALLGEMFQGSTNPPDLSNWTLTDEYSMHGTNSQVFYMFYDADETDESKCPCINGKQCCPGMFGHGDACENAHAECVRSGEAPE